jgi:hypothetical protein
MFTNLIFQLRAWERSCFPKKYAAMSFDIIFLVASSQKSGKPLSVKTLQQVLSHNRNSVGDTIKFLVEEHYLLVVPSKEDGRIKVLQGTQKLFQLVHLYETKMLQISLALRKV